MYDSVVEIEDVLIAALADASDVDGHDVGSDQMNIFIWTDDPAATFAKAEAAVGTHALWEEVRAAFREASGDDYTVIWPKDLQTFEIA